ncbi:hypothetical protein GCM10010347_58040 [Streptomyces cirratus]|uniref:DUF218 domain-containing protein n=1 Tax=Streptomyces cirratus TaxID=68187 RepID=A0ABQ3F305_9ACTN|nr:hypothetical protein GCM10010347_58040 [Streptomyces cirratus]
MPRGEAEHYRERALELGVPAEAVLVESNARNTGENIRFSRALLADRGVHVSSVLLVSKPHEERRAYATAQKFRPAVEFISASAPMTLAEYAYAGPGPHRARSVQRRDRSFPTPSRHPPGPARSVARACAPSVPCSTPAEDRTLTAQGCGVENPVMAGAAAPRPTRLGGRGSFGYTFPQSWPKWIRRG